MKRILRMLVWVASVMLNVVTAFGAIVYLFGAVVWMHAPIVPALLITLAVAVPFLGLSWLLRRLGRSSYLRQAERS